MNFDRPLWAHPSDSAPLTAIIAVFRGTNPAQTHWVIGLGDDPIHALQAVFASAATFADNFSVTCLKDRIGQAYAAASPACDELRIQDPSWDILIKLDFPALWSNPG